ncbi:soluble adenylyl cyclase [Skeletonema marinoi]|uniref:Soluble adenylyl cyclase n=1 Tax=Skeletonema marinoi TaxID=267567 RepID=A0AAD8YJQ3_9STRA|nr:soluble adenylyl cyclase [Skeletonema marinoi]
MPAAMSLDNGKQFPAELRRGTWIGNEEIELMMNEEDTASKASELKNGSVNRFQNEVSNNEIDDGWRNRAKGRRVHEMPPTDEMSGLKFDNSVISADYFSEDELGASDDDDDVGESNVEDDGESELRAIAAAHHDVFQLKKKPMSTLKDNYRSQNSMETSASESSSRRRGRNPRRDKISSTLQKSTSTPSLDKLVNLASSINSSFIVRKKDDSSSWRGLEYGKPRLSQRRSLSPNKTGQGGGGGTNDGPLQHMQMKSSPPPENSASTSLYDNPSDVKNREPRVTVRRQRQQRRKTMQDIPSIRQTVTSLGAQDDGMDELMDRNAMRYLPKILRDVYAQRERRRDSLLGNARLASIDLRLRLQRPDHLPHYQDIRGSILILDLSGFTALGERLRSELGSGDGAAEFANRVNSTLSMMVKQVHRYWGDVLMFAGDALICLFEEKCDEDDEFSIHGGAAHGMIRCFFLGTLSKKPGSCAFVVSGHPLKQTGNLLNKAGQGEVYFDGEELPITENEGILFLAEIASNDIDEDEGVTAAKNHVSPRDSVLLSDAETSVDAVGGFGVNAYARAFLGTLAARRLDQGSQNAMSMLLNELRPVAIVFVGLHDLDDIDPRDSSLLQLMNEAFKILSRITHSCNGAVRDMLFDDKGCVFISVFGAHSHEVNPCFDATVSAMRMENALKGLKLNRFSLGVSFGECFCGEVGPEVRSDYVVMGPEVNMAARLMSKAPNRGTLVSKRIFSRSNDFIHFEKSEKIQVKGKDGFFHAYIPRTRIDHQNVEIAATQQPFVLMPSRQAAMNSLVNVKDQAASGEPAIAFVSGGPFLGKSRLIDEVAAEAASDGFTVLKSFRTSLDSFTSFFPLRQIVAAAMIKVASTLRGEDFDSEVEAADYLVQENVFKKTDRVNIGSIVPQVADAQLLSLLSGMNPNARTKSIVDSMMKILKLLNPLIIILEGDGDIDPSSWSLLAEIMQRAKEECPTIMIIVSSRNSPTITSAASNLRRNAVQVKLTPFEKNETEQYLRFLLRIEDTEVGIDQRLIDVVHDRANGCPLFIESVARWAHEKNLIEFVEGSKKMTLKMLDERSDDVTDAIPRELSNILLAPFNHLSPPLWDALKIASCIGYSFDSDLYRALNQELELIPKIEELSEKYGCFEHTGTHFRWKQQAVYEAVKSLLMVNQRQIIHRMIVDAFRANDIDPNDLVLKGGDVHRLLGRHCALAEDWASAFEQYIKAGDRAKAAFNFNEASKMYEEAIDYQAKMTEPLTLRSRMIPTINLAETNSAAIALDDELYVRALTAMAALHQARSNYDDARQLYEKAVPIARNIHESGSSLWLAGNIAGYAETLRKSGDLPQAELHHREALEIRTRAVEEKSCTELELAVSYTQLGCTLAGMRRHNEAYQQHHRALGLRYRYLDFSHGLVSESMNYCAESLCALGRGVEGIPLALHAVEIRKTIFGTTHPAYAHALSILASCYQSVGRSFDARDCLEKCLEIYLKKARTVYQRAIAIHQLNFKEGQQASRLEKCRAEVDNLADKILQLESPSVPVGDSMNDLSDDLMKVQLHSLAPADVESDGTPVIVFTDIGRDVDDELSLVLLSALRRKHLLNPIAIIATLSPQDQRAHLARGSIDSMGMPDVPVGIGSSGGVDDDIELEVYDADYSIPSPCIYQSGIELVYAALESVPPNSAQLLCIASLADVATVMREREELFTAKVKEVVVMGGVVSPEIGETLVPDSAYNNNCDISAARYVYRKCQEIGIPTVTLSRWAAYGCPMPPQLLDEMSATEHMVARNIRSVSKISVDQLWNKVRLHPSDPRREKIPNRCDVNWFCRTFMSKGELSKDWKASVWSLVQKLNMYDPLAMLLAVPAYRTAHFAFKEKVVNGVTHLCVGTSERDTGIKNRLALFDEYSTLFLSAFEESLHRKVNIN